MDVELERVLVVAERWLDVDKPERALATLEQAGDAAAEYPRAYQIRALAHAGLRRPELAAEAARAGLRLQPDDVNLLYLLAEAHRDLGDLAEAERLYAHTRRLHPQNVTLCLGQAELAARLRQEPLARALLDEAARLRPDDPGLPGARAAVAYHLGRHDEAVAWARRAVAEDPGDPRGHALIGAAQLQLRRYEEASSAFGSAAALDPANPAYGTAARGASRVRLGTRAVASLVALLVILTLVLPSVGGPLLIGVLVSLALPRLYRRRP